MESQEHSMNGLKRILEYAHGNVNKVVKAVILIFLSVLSGIGGYIFTYPIIKGLVNEATLEMSTILGFGGGVAMAGVLKAIFFNKGLEASHEAAYAILYKMRKKVAEKMMKMPLGDVHGAGVGSFKKKTVDDIESVEIILAHMIPEGVPYLAAPIIVYIILFVVDWRMALLAMGSLPFGILALGIMMYVGTERMPKAYEATNKMNKTIVEYVGGMEVIKIFGRSTDSYERYASSVNDYKTYILDWWRVSWPWMALYSVVLPCTIIFMLPVGLSMYRSGSLSLEVFVFSVLLGISLGSPLVKLIRFFPAVPQLAQRVTEVEKIYDNRELIEGNKELNIDDYSVEFDGVTFAYDEKDVLRDVSFCIDQGTLTAIVGESGSGKSSLAKLLVHYWDVKSGAIKVGGMDIRDTTVEKLMNHISYVDQDTFLYNMSLMENIRLGRLDATDEEVIKAAEYAQCHDFIMDMRDGYNTNAGEAGTKLSGGQRQRITLARAILKDSPIIILDEATAYADPENEDKIQEALSRLTKGKTVIVIAHRLSTIVGADQIIVMDKGELMAKGKHEELLEDCDIYKNLWTAHKKSMDWSLDIKDEIKEVQHA